MTDPTPAPTLTYAEMQAGKTPDGWESVVVDGTSEPFVICGWTTDHVFHQYGPTDRIVLVLLEALHQSIDRNVQVNTPGPEAELESDGPGATIITMRPQ